MKSYVRAILDWLADRRDLMVAELERIVRLESPSRDKSALDRLCSHLERGFREHRATVERLPHPIGGDHLRVEWHGRDKTAPALVLCHFDTVWELGSIESIPFRIDGGRAYGPGIYDMKASLVMLDFALRAIEAAGVELTRAVVALLTSDEEIGSPTSRECIEAEARKASHVLVAEPPLPDGSLKTARKGVGSYTLRVTGRAAHAGVEPEKGASAIVELAHQILRINSLTDMSRGTTVNVGVIKGGSTVNTVPAEAMARIDIRIAQLEECDRIEHVLHALKPQTPGTTLELTGGINRPPMVRTDATGLLFERAREVGVMLGLPLGEGSTGGGSDGNFTAALGVPTLDGLGCPGDGAHARHEHIFIQGLTERTALLAGLLLMPAVP